MASSVKKNCTSDGCIHRPGCGCPPPFGRVVDFELVGRPENGAAASEWMMKGPRALERVSVRAVAG